MSVIVIAGPTAVGKSALALRLALKHDAVILCADAMTVYRGLEIGTAKPTAAERAEIPHFGLDLCAIDQEFSVADFLDLFDDVVHKHPRVILVGGTHFYLNALFHPMPAMPSADLQLRAKLQAQEDLYEQLQKHDPEIARRLHPNDTRRIIRALEVFYSCGIPMSEVQKKTPKRKPLEAAAVWLERDDLRERVFRRIDVMLEQGYWAECERLVQEGWDRGCKPLLSFSYRYMLAALHGECTKQEAIERTGFGTWKLVRKQRTWGKGLGWPVVKPTEIEEWFNSHPPFIKRLKLHQEDC